MSNNKFGMTLKARLVVRWVLLFVVAVIVVVCLIKAFSGDAEANDDFTNVPTATLAVTTPTPSTASTPMPTSTTTPIFTSVTSTASVVPVSTNVNSSEISQKSIIQDGTGIKQMMVLKSDLSKLDYDEIVINVWDGVTLLANSKGIVGEIYGRETAGYRRNAKVVDENVTKTFFTNDGELYADNAREGDAHQMAELSSYNLNKVRFVQIEGEDFYRLVVIGTPTTVKGSTGSSGNAASQEPSSEKITTPEPELRPSEDFVAATPNPTLRPRDDVVDTGVAMPNPSLRANEETLETSAPAPSLSNSADTASMPAPSLRGLDFD